MGHAEVIFETGDKSVLSYDDEQEVLDFVKEHTARAKAGQPGSTQNFEVRDDIEPELAAQAKTVARRPAERITKVLLYDEHPLNYNQECNLSIDQVNSLVSAVTNDEGMICIFDLINALRGEVNAVISGDLGPHESHYKMPHTSELDISGVI